MNAKADPTAQALAILRAELAFLQSRKLAPTEQAAIGRMIEREVALRPVFEAIWDPAHIRPHREQHGLFWLDRPVPQLPPAFGLSDCFHPLEFARHVNHERAELLRLIVNTAATVPDLAKHRREALKGLPELLDDFGKQAKVLAKTLRRINHHAHAGGLLLPSRLSTPITLMMKAAEAYGPDSFDLIARDDLVALASDYRRHLPDLQAMLDSLAAVNRAELEDMPDPFGYKIKRQSNAIHDFARTLLRAWRSHWVIEDFLQYFEFTAAELVRLAEVMTGTDKLPKKIEPRMNEIIKEHRDG